MIINPAAGLANVIEKRKAGKPKDIVDALDVALDIYETMPLGDKDKAALGLVRNAMTSASSHENAISSVQTTLNVIGTLTAPTKRSSGTGGKGKGGVDPRLPKPGSQLLREFKSQTFVVEVLEGGRIKTLHDGQEFNSLSAAAQHITGKATNGYDFFHINGSVRPAAKNEEATAVAEEGKDEPEAAAAGSGKGKGKGEPEAAAAGSGKGKGKGKGGKG